MTLPSFDGKQFVRREAPSSKRHARETMAFLAKESGFSSTTQCRRTLYINEHGSEEIKEAMLNGQVSVWFAYKYVKKQEEIAKLQRLRQLIKATPPLPQERKK
jgi:hypothetical protein